MTKYAIRRLIQTVPVFFGITIISFMMIHLAPGTPIGVTLDPKVSPAVIEQMRKNFHLDDPYYMQYWHWLKGPVALTHAINRDVIIKYILYDLGVIATGPFPPQMWYANNDIKPLAYDPALSKRLLAEAGWKDTDGDGILEKDGRRFQFRLITNHGNNVRQNVAVLVQRQLREVGIEVEILMYEWSVFISRKINPRDFEACVLGWSLSLDPDIYEIWHSSQVKKGFNFVGYVNPKVDRLIEEGRTEYDRATRVRIYREIHRLINEDQPYTFLFVGEGTPALHKGAFKLMETTPGGREVLKPITMPKGGLFYHLIEWIRVSGPTLSPT